MTGMIFAASVSLWRTTAVTNATTAVQQSSRFAAPALTDAVPRMVTTPCLIAIAASPMDDRMWDAGSSPTQMVSTTFGETLGSSLWWDRMCSGKYPVGGASVGVGRCLTGRGSEARTRVGREGCISRRGPLFDGTHTSGPLIDGTGFRGEDTGCGRLIDGTGFRGEDTGCGARKAVHLLLPCRRCQRFLP